MNCFFSAFIVVIFHVTNCCVKVFEKHQTILMKVDIAAFISYANAGQKRKKKHKKHIHSFWINQVVCYSMEREKKNSRISCASCIGLLIDVRHAFLLSIRILNFMMALRIESTNRQRHHLNIADCGSATSNSCSPTHRISIYICDHCKAIHCLFFCFSFWAHRIQNGLNGVRER